MQFRHADALAGFRSAMPRTNKKETPGRSGAFVACWQHFHIQKVLWDRW
jgi:hypothetical protein